MRDEHMLMYVLVFVLGFMVARMMGGRLVEGGSWPDCPGGPCAPENSAQGCSWAQSARDQDMIDAYCS